jgi:hypothetical protein
VEPPARFPYTNALVCPQCPLTVLKGVERVMRKVAVFSLLLIAGMVGAQLLPGLAGDVYVELLHGLRLATMVALAFIMIHVGYEFELDKTDLGRRALRHVGGGGAECHLAVRQGPHPGRTDKGGCRRRDQRPRAGAAVWSLQTIVLILRYIVLFRCSPAVPRELGVRDDVISGHARGFKSSWEASQWRVRLRTVATCFLV